MKTNRAGIELIKAFEGIMDGNPKTVNLDPYLCPAGYWTIGFGHVIRDASGKMLKGIHNKSAAYAAFPNGITKTEADILLGADIIPVELGVMRLVKVALTPNQFSAIVSFAYNIGLDEDIDTIPEGLGDSTLLKKLNSGCYSCASSQFPKWNTVAGKVLDGLTRRRLAEQKLFNTK